MATLNFVPDRDGYSIKELEQFRSVETMGGFPRVRRDLLDSTFIATCQFTFGQADKYNEFLAFYEAYKKSPAWFDVMLVSDVDVPNSKLVAHKAQFVPGTFALQMFFGHTWKVAVQLEAYRNGVS